MEPVSIQELIDAGVHFGCRVSRWNPKMERFIHARRNLIHIIDLRETVRGILRAENVLYHMAADGAQILWVGTKRQVKGVIHDSGQRTGMPVVIERWIGGTLTNFSVIRSRLRRLVELETMEEDGSFDQLSKKEVSSLRREKRKITRNLGGIREMGGIPGAMVVVDPAREANAVREARKMGVVVIGLLDTDCDPSMCDIVIPGNDDALKSVRLLIDRLSSAVEAGAANARERAATMGAAERTEDVEMGDEPRPTRTPRPLPPRKKSAEAEAPAEVAAGTEDSGSEAAAPESSEANEPEASEANEPEASEAAESTKADATETAETPADLAAEPAAARGETPTA